MKSYHEISEIQYVISMKWDHHGRLERVGVTHKPTPNLNDSSIPPHGELK